MKINKKLYAKILVLALCIFVLFRLVMNPIAFIHEIKTGLTYLMGVVSYFLYGLVLAFLLNPIVTLLEKLKLFKKLKSDKLKRGISVTVAFLFLLGIVTVFIIAIIPVISKSVVDIANNVPNYFASAKDYYMDFAEKVNLSANFDLMSKVESWVSEYAANFIKTFDFTYISSAVTGAASTVLKVLFGLLISIYMLFDKERIIDSLKNVIKAVFNEKGNERLLHFGVVANKVFNQFLIGKLIDSFLVSVACYIGFLIIGVPNALFFSIVIGVSNMIPYFGPLFGSIPVVILISLSNLMTGIWAGVFVLVFMQIDAWLIEPKIMGGKIGINPLVIIAGITICSSLFGIVGMFIGVPVAAIIKIVFYDNFILEKLKKKNKLKIEGDVT